MSQLMIHLLNWAFLVIILVGFPTVTSMRIVGLQLTAVKIFQQLTLCGFAVAIAANLAAAFFFTRKRRFERLYYNWALVHGALLVFVYLLFNQVINFEWLKQALLWLKNQVK